MKLITICLAKQKCFLELLCWPNTLHSDQDLTTLCLKKIFPHNFVHLKSAYDHFKKSLCIFFFLKIVLNCDVTKEQI